MTLCCVSAKAEEAEAEEMKKQLGLNDTADSLQALILERNKKRAGEMDSFLDSLAAKYGGGAGEAPATAAALNRKLALDFC
ncbi:DnaJ subfamily C member 9 [Portunus trituberculatus]|uniref:DnaJ subfamily C member 9 n=1 Tax=Portunus trituberculatus TaxID=210409 RepID=A0A5B7DL16_PORTR|nr:DnaJ subfamily C member 9 [Portunus trituberculatus]